MSEPIDAAPSAPVPAPARTRAENEALVASVYPLIRGVVRDAKVPVCDRPDVEQDACLALWRAMGRFDPAKSKITTFAAMIARAAVSGYLEAAGKQPRAFGMKSPDKCEAAAEDFAPRESETAAEAVDGLAACFEGWLEDLSPRQRELFRLLAVERLSAEQVAARLGQKLSIVELNLRAMVRTLIEAGRIPAELLAKLEQWRELDSIRPARKAYRPVSYRGQKDRRRTEKPTAPPKPDTPAKELAV